MMGTISCGENDPRWGVNISTTKIVLVCPVTHSMLGSSLILHVSLELHCPYMSAPHMRAQPQRRVLTLSCSS
eukprot:1969675-Amphidinium_carterae.1